VEVRQHGPEPAHGRGGDGYPKLRDITFQEGTDESFPPSKAVCLAGGEKRTGKPAAQPETVSLFRRYFRKIESGQVNKLDSSGKGFRNPLDDMGRCGPSRAVTGERSSARETASL
jgi:hypothetical protein